MKVLFLPFAFEKSEVKCWKKVSPSTAFSLVVNFLSPESAFLHQG
jgi:hypothetical protein